MYDLIVRDGTVFDGMGSAPVQADVAVEDGVVVEIGDVTGSAALTIDAEGHFVAPGFIDGHTHLDAQIFWDPLAGSLAAHGVTTAIMGNCGFTLAPGSEADADLILRSIERAEDMSRAAISAGVPWRWTTFPQFLDAIDRTPKALNVAAQIGHSAIRASVMGERAFSDVASDHEIEQMEALVREAITVGAIGFTTSRSTAHLTRSGEPVASRHATWDELKRLVMVMGALGAGVFQLAPERPTEAAPLEDFRDRLSALAVASGRLVTFMIGVQESQMTTVERIATAGGAVAGQVNVRAFENIFGFRTAMPFDKLPVWRELRCQPLEEQRRALGDVGLRARLVEELARADYGEPVGAEVRAPQFDRITVIDGSATETSLAELAAARRIHPVELMIELSLDKGFEQLFRQPLSPAPEPSVLATLRHPHTVIAASDSGAHVSQLLDSNIPTYFLSHWVREACAFSWEQGIAMLTSVPAALWGLKDRGVLREGSRSDLVVFDPERVGTERPVVVNDLPDGGQRLAQGAVGMRAVVVGGQPTLVDGQPTGHTPGRLLRSGVDDVA